MPTRLESVTQLDFAPRGPVFPSPSDWRDQFLYQLLIDRFDDNQDHPPYDPKQTPKGRDIKTAAQFQGGNLKGITRRLDYTKAMGVTGLWLSPPFKQRQDNPASYHGYGIQDFLAIDPRFGSTEDLRELVREAHKRGMYVILDIVINHTADVFRYKGPEPHPFNPNGKYEFDHWHKIFKGDGLGPDDAVWPKELQNPDCFNRRGSIVDLGTKNEQEALQGDFFSLKDLDLFNPKAIDALIQSYKYWIASCDIDGYRVDTVKNMEPEPVSVFCNAIHEYAQRIGKTNFLIFGEIVGDDALLRKYVGSNTPLEGQEARYPHLDACLDFPLYAVLDEILKGEKPPGELFDRYYKFRKFYRDFAEAGRYYVTFVDNHDQTHRPWRRYLHDHSDPRLAVLAATYLLTNIGIPCLYYGTEQGFDGGGDQDVFIRECMFGGKWGAFDTSGHQFFNPRHPVYQQIGPVAKIRAEQPAMRYGRQYFREISGNGKDFGCPRDAKATLAYSRVLDTDEIIICLNLDTEPRSDWVLVDGKLTAPGREAVDLLGRLPPMKVEPAGEFGAIRVPLAGRSAAILKAR